MSTDVDSEFDDSATVTEGGVTVEKSFVTDDFPVPVVEFVLRSSADQPVDVRLTDDIPESFPMDGVGFHPDYDGDRWTAYGDHRVEYECTIDPDETVRTVYGIQIDDPTEAADFLSTPTLDVVGTDEVPTSVETADDVLGRDTTQAVRDALSGESDIDTPSDDEVAAALDADDVSVNEAEDGIAVEAETDEPDDGGGIELADPTGIDTGADDDGGIELDDPTATTDADDEETTSSGTTDADDGGIELADPTSEDGPIDLADPTADDPETEGANESAVADDISATSGTSAGDAAFADDASTTESEIADDASTTTPESGSVAAALADEIRAGEVSDDDLDLLREELDVEMDDGVPTSVDVRLDRLQTRTDDLAAYTDALEEFLDEEGTGQELITGFRDDVEALREDLAAVEEEIESGRDARASLAETTDDLGARQASLSAETYALAAGQADIAGTADDLAERTETLAEATDAVEERLDETVDDLAAATDRVDLLDDEVGQVRSDLADVADDVESVDEIEDDLADLEATVEDVQDDLEAVESVEDDVADVQETVEGIEEDIETLMEFRDRLSSAFGTGE